MSEPSIQEEAKNKLKDLKIHMPAIDKHTESFAIRLAKDLESQGSFSPALYIVSYRSVIQTIEKERQQAKDAEKEKGKIVKGSANKKAKPLADARLRGTIDSITKVIFPPVYAREVITLTRNAGGTY